MNIIFDILQDTTVWLAGNEGSTHNVIHSYHVDGPSSQICKCISSSILCQRQSIRDSPYFSGLETSHSVFMSQNQQSASSQRYSFPDGISPEDLHAILSSLSRNPGSMNGGFTVSLHSKNKTTHTYNHDRSMAFRRVSMARLPTLHYLPLRRTAIHRLYSIRVISYHLHQYWLETHLLQGPASPQVPPARPTTSAPRSISKC